MEDSENSCCFKVTSTTNANRGPTDAQSDETPFERKLRQALVDRFGKAPGPQTGIGDTMSDSKFGAALDHQ